MSIGVMFILQGVPPNDLQKLLTELHWVRWFELALGFFGTMLGGYVAARMGKTLPLRHGFAVAVASVVTSALALVMFPSIQPMWASVIALSIAVPAGLLGGYICAARKRRLPGAPAGDGVDAANDAEG